MVEASMGDALIGAMRLTMDGQGGMLHVAALDSMTADDLAFRASELGLNVLDVSPSRETRPFAFGALASALNQQDSIAELEPVEVDGLPVHVAAWLERQVVFRLAELSARTPVLAIVRNLPRHDSMTVAVLERVASRFVDEPVLWLIVGVANEGEVGFAEPNRSVGLQSLSEDAGLILEVLSLADGAPQVGEIAGMSGLRAETVQEVVDELSALGLIAESAAGYVAFADADLRTTVKDTIPHVLQRDMRRSWIDVLARRGVSPVILSSGALQMGSVGDEELAHLLIAAMAALREDDPDAAAVVGLGAVDLLDDPSESFTAHAWSLLPLLWQTSRSEEAKVLTRRVFAGSGQGEIEAQVLFWLARFEGSAERSVKLTGDALAIPGISDQIKIKLLGVRIRCLSTLGRAEEVDAALPLALEMADRVGDFETLSRLQSSDSIRRFYEGDYGRAREQSELAQGSFDRSGLSAAEWMPELMWHPFLTMILGESESALIRCDALLHQFAPLRQVSATRFLHSLRATIMYATGRLAEASDEALAASNVSQQLWGVSTGASDRLQSMVLSVRLKTALLRGDAHEIEEIRRVLDGPGDELSSEARHRRDWLLFVLADAQPRRSVLTATEEAGLDALVSVSWLDPTDELLMYRALVNRGNSRVLPEEIVHNANRRAGSNPGELLPRAIVDHLAGLAGADGAALSAAADEWTRLGRPLLAAAAQEDRGMLESTEGTEAIELLRQAHDVFDRAGASREAGRVRQALRDRGHVVRGDRRGLNHALSPAEVRVVQRAVQGATSTQIAAELFLSPHTVVSHLRSVYRKLNLRSRRELVIWSDSTPDLFDASYGS